jgi:hypothetical protein
MDGIERRPGQDVKSLAADVIHRDNVAGVAPLFEDSQQQSRSIVRPNVCPAGKIKKLAARELAMKCMKFIRIFVIIYIYRQR